MQFPKYDAYQAVQLVIPAGDGGTAQTNSIYYFGDQPSLRVDKASIVGVELYTANSVTYSGWSNLPLLSLTAIKKATITFYGQVPVRNEFGEFQKDPSGVRLMYQKGGEFIQRLQLIQLNTLQNASTDPFSRSLFRLNDASVDFSKSYVNFTDGPGNTVNSAIAFGVYYNYL